MPEPELLFDHILLASAFEKDMSHMFYTEFKITVKCVRNAFMSGQSLEGDRVNKIFCVLCPAMNTAMYENAVTQDNLKSLASYGMRVIEPDSGRLACGDVGAGKMPEPELLFLAREAVLYAAIPPHTPRSTVFPFSIIVSFCHSQAQPGTKQIQLISQLCFSYFS